MKSSLANRLAPQFFGGCRYHFNGKESDDEMKGSGNSYDFGARMYDARLGRWMSTDPHFTRNSSLSSYSFSEDSPIVLNDPDGMDARVTITENADGSGGVIEVSTTVHVYGKDANIVVDQANEKFAGLNNSYTYIDPETNKSWTVVIKVQYVEDQQIADVGKTPDQMTREDLSNTPGFVPGDNVMCTDCPVVNGSSENTTEKVYNGFAASGVTGGGIANHTMGHFLGTADDYTNTGDITSYQVTRIDDIHYIRIAERFLHEFTGEPIKNSAGEGFYNDPVTGVMGPSYTQEEAAEKVAEQQKLQENAEGAPEKQKEEEQSSDENEDGD